MPPQHKFRPHPRADAAVVELLEQVLMSARKGHVKTIAIIAVNQLHAVERAMAGDMSDVRSNALLAGLARVQDDLLRADRPKSR